jgi:hypothetical protein
VKAFITIFIAYLPLTKPTDIYSINPVILIGVDTNDKHKVLALELGSCITNTIL